jgi:signal transduction histidine kinase
MIAAPIYVDGERRGLLHAASTVPDLFGPSDLRFLEAAANWIGTITHRAELIERITQDAIVQARHVAADELITILAHDLGNYITPLRGRLDLLRRRARREARETDLRDANEALTAIGRLQGLINDLLDAGRLEQGIFSISRELIDLSALVQETVEVMRTNRQQTLLHLPEEVTLEADPARIRQALENLLSNAVKHSPPGTPVDVDLRCETREDGDWAVISVSDQGPGIPQQLLPRLFTRFASGPGSSGLGLGLYLARSISEAHGGTLTVETGPAKGTTFRMSLPASPGFGHNLA